MHFDSLSPPFFFTVIRVIFLIVFRYKMNDFLWKIPMSLIWREIYALVLIDATQQCMDWITGNSACVLFDSDDQFAYSK